MIAKKAFENRLYYLVLESRARIMPTKERRQPNYIGDASAHKREYFTFGTIKT